MAGKNPRKAVETVPGKPIPYARQVIDVGDMRAVAKALMGERLTTGPLVTAFEEAFAAYAGAPHAVAFNSGTAALHAAALAAGLEPGLEAITTPLTFAATANAVVHTGARPVFADVSTETLTLDPGEVRKKITRRTRALLPVDYGGHPADLDPMMEAAREHGLTVIEDACHAPGARYRGRPVGSIADVTVFSFHPVKHITTGEGGMAVTASSVLADKMRRIRNHGVTMDADQRNALGSYSYDIEFPGFNYRMPDLNAALGLSQLAKLPGNLGKRKKIAAAYGEAFKDIPCIKLPVVMPWAVHAWHLYPVRLDAQAAGIDRDGFLLELKELGVLGNFHYPPVHLMTFYRKRYGFAPGLCPVAEEAASALFSLPMHHGMTSADVTTVVKAVKNILGAG